jgi:hypothetical protein
MSDDLQDHHVPFVTTNGREFTLIFARGFLGSTGCQPVLFGSLPRSFSERSQSGSPDCRRQAVDDYRLAACAPQNELRAEYSVRKTTVAAAELGAALV